MALHPVFREKHALLCCIYCRGKLDDEWVSDFHPTGEHYKNIVCDGCGRTNHVKVDFLSSGHDDFGGLEKKI